MDEIRLDWSEALKFTAHRAGFDTSIDGDQEIAPSPVGLLLEAVAACAAIDVVIILNKGRQDLRALSVTARATRAESPPRYIKQLEFAFEIEGDVEEEKARRAVELSFEKYCSVYHSLRRDIELEWSVSLKDERRLA